jgi:hypothetical protein
VRLKHDVSRLVTVKKNDVMKIIESEMRARERENERAGNKRLKIITKQIIIKTP